VTEAVIPYRGIYARRIDLQTKRVVVTGRDLDDEQLRAAIAEAGYEAEGVSR
jgi:copper chaperone CopZ